MFGAVGDAEEPKASPTNVCQGVNPAVPDSAMEEQPLVCAEL